MANGQTKTLAGETEFEPRIRALALWHGESARPSVPTSLVFCSLSGPSAWVPSAWAHLLLEPQQFESIQKQIQREFELELIIAALTYD